MTLEAPRFTFRKALSAIGEAFSQSHGELSSALQGRSQTMSSIVRAVSPEVSEPPAGTWSNCLVAGGIAYIAGMTSRGSTDGDEYTRAKAIFGKIRHLVGAAGGSMADIVKVTIFVTDITQ